MVMQYQIFISELTVLSSHLLAGTAKLSLPKNGCNIFYFVPGVRGGLHSFVVVRTYENGNERQAIDAVETPHGDKQLKWRSEMEDMSNEGTENNAQADNTLENQKIDVEPAADRLLSPRNVSFFVYLDQRVTMSNHILRFNNVVYNYGDGYNVHTGVFTVPLTGAYLISFHLELGQYSYPITSSLYVNSKVMASSVVKPTYGINQASQTVILNLKTGESMYLKVDRGSIYGSSSARNTILTGVRLSYA
ncbi:complement C1q-like protein 4 [Mercenaria mercenaria]|uniref:complement C1q-like protein 4 n=1 Tax=Mercenaria mercenaria TaxID=6596 RepID=UPI00234E6A60|nr:complement C1q-like protein 4 [Mercenaria mercenaria]